MVVVGDADLLTKELVSMTIYNFVSKLKPEEAQKVAIMFVKNFDLKWSSDKPIYN